MKYCKHTGLILAVCMLAGCCTAPFSAASADDTAPLTGDANLDQSIDVADAVLIARYEAEDATAELTDSGKRNADVNADGNVDGSDLRQVLEFIARKRDAFTPAQPAEKLSATVNLTDSVTPSEVTGKKPDDIFCESQYALTAKLMQEITKTADKNKNLMISPLSFSLALTMAANGAKGSTQAELTELLGGELDINALNQYYYGYTANLPQSEKARLNIANAIWFIDKESMLRIPDAFLQTNKDYFHSDVYRSPFNDETVKDINNWVSDHTNGMIKKIVQNLDPDAVMMLVNALYFEAEWATPYDKDWDVRGDRFYLLEGENYRNAYSESSGGWQFGGSFGQTADDPIAFPEGLPFGEEPEGGFDWQAASRQDDTQIYPEKPYVDAEFMNSTEYTYLENDSMTGFMRAYKDNGYSFVGLLPKDDCTVADCIAGMTGESLKELFRNKTEETVYVKIPKFSFDYSVDLIPVMKALGVQQAFDRNKADFTGLNEYGDTFINMVLQKTRIEVDENGTKAAAATGIGFAFGGMPSDPKQVYLDHPFIYMIVDNETELPLFIGYVMNPGQE